jgi:hypothetical protein
MIAADRVNTGTFYAVDSSAHIWRSTDGGGATWTNVYSGGFTGGGGNVTLLSVPNNAGHLLFSTCGGVNQGSYTTNYAADVASHPVTVPLYLSTNGGTSWTALPGIQECAMFAVGGTNPSGTYPSIFVAGWVGGVYSIWRSDNQGASWINVGNGPGVTQIGGAAATTGWFDVVFTMVANPSNYNEVLIGYGGSGFSHGGIGI